MSEIRDGGWVRRLHDGLANDRDTGRASARPAGTSNARLVRMVEDVFSKLPISPADTVVEIGCGIGVLGLPIASRAGSYLGLDFAPRAVERFARSLDVAGLSSRASVIEMDFLRVEERTLEALGNFSRVLAYAVLHYVRTGEGERFVRRAVRLAAPAGLVLLGNLPIEELWPSAGEPRSLPVRLRNRTRSLVAAPGWLPGSRRWAALLAAYDIGRRLTARRIEIDETPGLPADYLVPLTRARVEGWLSRAAPGLDWSWLPARVGIPLHQRPDLVVRIPTYPPSAGYL